MRSKGGAEGSIYNSMGGMQRKSERGKLSDESWRESQGTEHRKTSTLKQVPAIKAGESCRRGEGKKGAREVETGRLHIIGEKEGGGGRDWGATDRTWPTEYLSASRKADEDTQGKNKKRRKEFGSTCTGKYERFAWEESRRTGAAHRSFQKRL